MASLRLKLIARELVNQCVLFSAYLCSMVAVKIRRGCDSAVSVEKALCDDVLIVKKVSLNSRQLSFQKRSVVHCPTIFT